MARLDWGMICSVREDVDLDNLREFGKWFTTNVRKYGIQINQLYNFTQEPFYVNRLEPCQKGSNETSSMDTMYENISKKYPNVSFVIHILPHKNSVEFEKMKQLTCRFSLIGQGILLENALSRFSGAEEASVFNNVNQYIARRFAQIVDFKHNKRETAIIINRRVVPLKGHVDTSCQNDDIASTVITALHWEKMERLIRTQGESKHFKNCATISGLPEHYTRNQVSAIFSRWNVASVMLTARSCAFIEFFNDNAVYQAKSYFTQNNFEDPKTKTEYKIRVCPIQSRYMYSKVVEVDANTDIKESKQSRIPFLDTTNRPLHS